MSTRSDTVPAKRWTETSVRSDGMGAEDNRTLGSLIKELSDDSTRLLRQEIELAKAEMREKLDVYKANMTKMVIGGSLLVAALFGLLITINHGLTALLDQFMNLSIAYWLSPLIITVVIGLIGRSMVASAKANMSSEGIVPRETIDSLKGEKKWIEEKVK
jgi:hypothetical protein